MFNFHPPLLPSSTPSPKKRQFNAHISNTVEDGAWEHNHTVFVEKETEESPVRSVQSHNPPHHNLAGEQTNSLSTEVPKAHYCQNQNWQLRINKTLLLLFLIHIIALTELESHLHVFSSYWKAFIPSVDPLYCHTFSNKNVMKWWIIANAVIPWMGADMVTPGCSICMSWVFSSYAPPCSPHCGSRFHSCDMVWAWFIVLVQLQWTSPRQHHVHLVYVPYYPFPTSSPSFSFLYLLFSAPASFQINNLPQLCFPHWSVFCYLHTHIKYFWYYCYLDNLGPPMYRCFSYPGIAWPWKVLLPSSYLSSLAITYNSSLSTCEIQPVLMALSFLSFSHRYPAHPAISHIL